ncbi:cytochrome P450 [Nocardia sp. SYP-A9097]|uniref:cytochrome P450 n=1 Tax=Nocardia sp. SYP-A9097 TaxID=2663237 RepID=UPI00129B527F|nr:cytochrome P450 [Nocardia sp. SYP-A9097]MRH88602.1 cytochrome P450 [Nocardia sp. SYP-A9097]
MAVKPPLVPNAKPLIGHALDIWQDPLKFFSAAARTAPLSRIKIGWKDACLISNHELLYQILVTDAKKYDKGIQYERARAMLGDGVLLAEGDLHFRQRRLMQPMFNKPSVNDYIDAMHTYSTAMVESWRDKEVVELYPEFYRLATRVVIDTLFSTIMSDADVELVRAKMPVVIAGIEKRGALPPRLFDTIPTPENRAFYSAIADLRGLGDRLVDDRLSMNRDGDARTDLMDVLTDTEDEITRRDNDRAQILNEFLTFLTAGSETTPSAIAWSCYLLAKHPEIQEQVRAEVGEFDLNADNTVQAIQQLSLLHAVVKEALRLYPPVWALGRRSLEEISLGGYDLPSGTQVFYSVYAIQRDSTVYEDPDEFKPRRWIDTPKKYPRSAFLPFGAGVRNCIGEHFAWIEISIAIVNILQRYELSLQPGQQVPPAAMGALVPGALPVRLRSVVPR